MKNITVFLPNTIRVRIFKIFQCSQSIRLWRYYRWYSSCQFKPVMVSITHVDARGIQQRFLELSAEKRLSILREVQQFQFQSLVDFYVVDRLYRNYGLFLLLTVFMASHVILHHRYSITTFIYAIALIHLAMPLFLNDSNINPICSPSAEQTPSTNDEWPSENKTVKLFSNDWVLSILFWFDVVAIGWGRLNLNGPLPSILQQVTRPLCVRRYSR